MSRAFARAMSPLRAHAVRNSTNTQPLRQALLTTSQLHAISEGRMIPRAAPTALPAQPKSWIVTIAGRGADGAITKIRVREESSHEVPSYVGAEAPTAAAPKGWIARVSKRDEAGLIRELHIHAPGKPEET